MAAASAVFGQRGKRDAALVLREEGERGEGVVELARWFQAGQGARRSEARSAGPSRRRRGASAAILGVRARDGTAWRGREASRRNQGRGAGRARHVAGGLNSTATSAWQKTGEGERAERVERKRERNLFDFKFESFSKFSINTRKILNTKDVPKFKSYHFCFRPTFIWDPIQKFNVNPDKCSYYPVRAKFKFFFDFCMKT